LTESGAGGYDAGIFEELAALEDESFWFRARNRLLVRLTRQLSKPGDRFLEIGCGTGYVLQALARECGLAMTGSELFPEGLEFARKRVPEADFSVLDAREMPYREEFDLAGAFDVLEHIDDDVGVLRGLHGALRPGGHLLITVPQHRWLWSDADDYAHHVRRYRRSEMVERVEGAGFEVLRASSFVTSLLPLMLASRLRRGQGEGSFEELAKELVPPAPINRSLEWMLNREVDLIARGVSLPAGGSLVVVARRLG
jgi:SAM-dependent methyltransferase